MVGLRAEDADLVTGILLCTVKEALSVKYTGDNAFFSGTQPVQSIAKLYAKTWRSNRSYTFAQLFWHCENYRLSLNKMSCLNHCTTEFPLVGRYQEAAKRYSEALQLIESLDSESFEQLTLTVLLNRTGCNMKLSMWPDVIQDCIRGLAIHPKHPKFLQVLSGYPNSFI